MTKVDGSGRVEMRRRMRSSTKVNSDFKWKFDRSVIGAFEIATEPDLNLKAPMELHKIDGCKAELQKCLEIWDNNDMRLEFIKAFESLAPETGCCGLFVQQDETIRKNIPLMNEGWIKKTNESVFTPEGFRISMYVWQWQNIAGKSETVIPMIRFHRAMECAKIKE